MKNGIMSFDRVGVSKEVFMGQGSLVKPFLCAVLVLILGHNAVAWGSQTQAPTLQQKRLEVAVARLLATFSESRYA